MHALIGLVLALTLPQVAPASQTVDLRGRSQNLRLYGPQTGEPIIVSSGDGGWVHLGPHIAAFLASRGYFVIGFDVRAYLTSFTSGSSTLDPAAEPKDYAVLAEFAKRTTGKKPLLIGVSEGAGLSLLAATDPQTKSLVTGVIGVGLPDINELGWRWRDVMIYVTHKVPNEPTFSTVTIAANVAPLPLAAIHSTSDEFVPLADVQRVIDRAKDPKRLWIVNAVDHRFSNNERDFEARLLEAMAWVQQHSPR
jgi:pimeloyl-ACP methyl ester carboxylesterase